MMNTVIFWYMTPCSSAVIYRQGRFVYPEHDFSQYDHTE